MLQFFANVRLSESQSDLLNYMLIDMMRTFEELFSLVKTQNEKKIVIMHDIIYYYSLFQITN